MAEALVAFGLRCLVGTTWCHPAQPLHGVVPVLLCRALVDHVVQAFVLLIPILVERLLQQRVVLVFLVGHAVVSVEAQTEETRGCPLSYMDCTVMY